MIEFKPSDFFYPLDLARTYALLRRSEHWSTSQFERYQLDRLARLLQHCADQVPYYRDLFQQIGLDASHWSPERAFETLRKLPLLDKDTLREHPAQFVARNAARFHPKVLATSGTTGTPLTVYWDRGSNVMELCSIQRLWRWAGIRIGHPFLDLRSRPITGQENHLIQEEGIRYIRNWKVNGLEFSSDLIDDTNVDRYYRILLRYRPRLVRGHPQAIQHLIDLLQRYRLTAWRPLAVTTTSEQVHDYQRHQVEQAWHLPILDSYGLREHNVFIAQCPEGSYHVYPEYGVCEILDDEGRPVSPNEEGWIVATGLHNYCQPLLRYNTRDRAIAASPEQCSCGRTLPTVKRIVGRIDDCVVTPDGRRYSGFSFAFFGRRGIKKARLVQENVRCVTVELITTREWSEAERTALVDALERKVEHKLRVEVKVVDEIIQAEPGKFKFVVSKLGNASETGQLTPGELTPAGRATG